MGIGLNRADSERKPILFFHLISRCGFDCPGLGGSGARGSRDHPHPRCVQHGARRLGGSVARDGSTTDVRRDYTGCPSSLLRARMLAAKHTPGPGRFQVPGPLPPSPRPVLSPQTLPLQLIILIFITYTLLIYTRPRSRLRLSFLAAYTVSPLLLSPMKLCTCLHLLSFYFPAASPIHLVDFDFDYVMLSSLDRHATDVGTPKVLSLSFLPMPCHADRFIYSSYSTLLCSRSAASRSRARWAEVDARVEVWRADKDGDANGEGEGGSCCRGAHSVVDAIHNIPTKEFPCCHERGTKVCATLLCARFPPSYPTFPPYPRFSSMGAGDRSELMRVQIASFASTVYDPLARSVRLTAPAPLAPQRSPRRARREEFKKGKVGELGVLDERRVRILPGLGPLPAIFGLHIAMYVLSELAIQNRRKVYERMLRDLQAKEAARAGTLVGRLPLDGDDVALFEDVHRGRNIVPPHAVPVKPTVVRWDPARALGMENVVVMEAGKAGVHESDGGEGGPGARGEDVREAVRRRVEEVERVGHVKKERRTRPRLLRGPRRPETRRHNAAACFKTYTRKPAMQQHGMDVFDMIYLEQGVGGFVSSPGQDVNNRSFAVIGDGGCGLCSARMTCREA
ncbi:hypothetical protein B0H14DRAFT_3473627 [Mycena olivaceomarginata]|nr:hypothetical protein B0H14DRAFT_3473627 [Mycena olivaceomarginata]